MNKIKTILQEIQRVLDNVDLSKITEFVKVINEGKRVFVIGEGRSGFMGKSFAMRLMHLGANVYVVGETITPAIEKGDVLVAISGSGTTKSVIMTAEKSKELGCKVLVVTTNPQSDLGALASIIIHVPAATKYRREGESPSIQPLGSLFDQCAHILFDSICLEYSSLKSQNNDSAFARHSNLE
ncbi:6-phospho-3-hexuloisomerase [Clostridium sp. DJ247]|uniref:6-phospho-3-hexuloisomerase n=1 Tax=Clostridium sp. DJ247 TaxID=2726188 RepID=UPI0016299D07|nr:6-phospho-3-hexuloisomerase [Clostridium sp. DJ247]MBC2581886.1 6-phospho-3-hexuloisomerase [Clostridium sp. DJ247]